MHIAGGVWDRPEEEHVMPKHQSTAAKKARAAARDGRKYTTALNEARGETAPQARAGSPQWHARRAADPGTRGIYLWNRFRKRTVRGRLVFNDTPRGRDQLLRLLYDMVLTARPELAPAVPDDAVAAADFDAIDAAFAPLDRAVRCLLAQSPASVWQQQLQDHVEALDAQTGPGWQARGALTGWYHRALTPVYTFDEWPRAEGLPYYGTCDTLDAVLVHTAGGYAPGTRVQLDDERIVYVLRVDWWDEHGGPDGYTVVPEDTGGDFEIRADRVVGAV